MEQAAEGTRYPLPPSIAAFAGELNDIDSHECIPIGSWVDAFGSEVIPLRDACAGIAAIQAGREVGPDGKADVPPPPLDNGPIDAKSVWTQKMENAPGAFDMARRVQVLDFVGVKRQILFPGAAPVFAHALYGKADDPKVFASITSNRKSYALRIIDLYNDWVARTTREQDRIRATAILVGDTPDELHARMKKLIDDGVRAFLISPDVPPAGLSPADPALDKVWALAAAAKTPILAHILISEDFLKTLVWREAPAFKGWMLGGEFSLDPWTLSNIHLAVQNYVMTMTLGGVFERHPDLMIGTAEFTGHWVGPLAQNMDRWYRNAPFQGDKANRPLKMDPSEYVRRNLRVMCFEFEPVGQYIDHFGLEEVYCYASDFPHHEGGRDPIGSFVKSLEGKSQQTLRKFFVDNGRGLLPD